MSDEWINYGVPVTAQSVRKRCKGVAEGSFYETIGGVLYVEFEVWTELANAMGYTASWAEAWIRQGYKRPLKCMLEYANEHGPVDREAAGTRVSKRKGNSAAKRAAAYRRRAAELERLGKLYRW